MRLVSFEGGFGRIEDDAVVPMGPSLVDWLASGTQGVTAGAPRPLEDVRLLAPVPRPGKVVCVGLNYRDLSVLRRVRPDHFPRFGLSRA